MFRAIARVVVLGAALTGISRAEVSVMVEKATPEETVPVLVDEVAVGTETIGGLVEGEIYCEETECECCPRAGFFRRGLMRIQSFWHRPAACEECACDVCDECPRPGLLQRLRGLLRKEECCEIADACCMEGECASCDVSTDSVQEGAVIESTAAPCTNCGGYVKPAPVRVKPLPATEERPLPTEGDLPSLPRSQSIPETKPSNELVPVPTGSTMSKRREEIVTVSGTHMAHAEDYSWLIGEIHFVHVQGGAWVLRYLPLDESDNFGGSVVLVRDARMSKFQEGDLVRVSGEVLRDRSTKYLGGPLYRIHDVKLIAPGARDARFVK